MASSLFWALDVVLARFKAATTSRRRWWRACRRVICFGLRGWPEMSPPAVGKHQREKDMLNHLGEKKKNVFWFARKPFEKKKGEHQKNIKKTVIVYKTPLFLFPRNTKMASYFIKNHWLNLGPLQPASGRWPNGEFHGVGDHCEGRSQTRALQWQWLCWWSWWVFVMFLWCFSSKTPYKSIECIDLTIYEIYIYICLDIYKIISMWSRSSSFRILLDPIETFRSSPSPRSGHFKQPQKGPRGSESDVWVSWLVWDPLFVGCKL